MAACNITYREIHFVIEDELTQVYVLMDADGDCPHTVQGWHHKTFARSTSIDQIIEKCFKPSDGRDDPVLWPRNAPNR
jgi:hypothetical protein